MTALETRRPRGRPPLFTPEQRQEVTAHVAARVTLGERLADILGRDGLPSRNAFLQWMRNDPELARGYRLARRASATRWWSPPGRPLDYNKALGEAVCARICEAAGLEDICAEPGMPSLSTVYRWLERHEAFAQAYGQARKIQADRLFDATRKIAEGATAASWRRDKLLIDTLRWQAGKLAPKRYGAQPDLEGRGDGKPVLNIVLRRFADDLAGDDSRDQVICRDGVYLNAEGGER